MSAEEFWIFIVAFVVGGIALMCKLVRYIWRR